MSSRYQENKFALAVICLLFLNHADGKTAKTKSFYRELQHTIIQLQHIETIINVEEMRYKTSENNGTAFFVQKGNSVYIVTAGHVVRKPFSFTSIVPLEFSDGASARARLTMLSDKWVFHPRSGDSTHAAVDIAAMKITEHGGVSPFLYCSQKNCPKNRIALAKKDMEPPTPIIVFGFPLDVKDLKPFRSVPLGRQGIIALIDKEDDIQVEGKYFDRLGFVIDTPTLIGGKSGSPVISAQPSAPYSIVGLVSAGAPLDKGGYAVAEPVSRIKELLDSPEVENMNPVDTWCWISQEDASHTKLQLPICH